MKTKCKACDFEFESFSKRETRFGRLITEKSETCDLCVALKKIHETQLNLKKLIEEAKTIAKHRKLTRNMGGLLPTKSDLN